MQSSIVSKPARALAQRGRSFILFTIVALGSSVTAGGPAARAESARPDLSAYQTVNTKPQYAETDKNFAFYWAVWRGLTEAEKTALGPSRSGDLVASKRIQFTSQECGSGKSIR